MQDIHITCALQQLLSMVDAFEEQFESQQEEVVVLDFGCSYKHEQGYIIIEWDGEVDEAIIDQLKADHKITDFCIYSVPCITDNHLDALELTDLQGVGDDRTCS